MEKMKMQTTDIANENFLKLAALFPNAVTETIDKNGEVVRAIDKDILMQEISTRVVEGNEERYQFTWPDKRQAMRLASTPIAATLRPCREESVNFDTTQNLYIEGDNLDVLKLLRETYLGAVKMIYIDPPYNTGSDLVYEDSRVEENDSFLLRDGQFDEQGNKLVKNTDSNGRFHTAWLNMIYPRLKVAKDLLAEEGVIFISIDDNEQENLQKVCNEIFGKSNFIGCIIRKTKTMTADQQNGLNVQHESLLIYAKKKDKCILHGEEKTFKAYSNPDNDPNGPWCAGDPSARSGGTSTSFPIRNPYTGREDYPPHGRYWAFSQTTLEKYIRDGKVKFKEIYGENERGFIFKRYKKDMDLYDPVHTLFAIENLFMNEVATEEINKLFSQNIFDYPKPVSLLQKIVSYTTGKNDLIIDFFSGSATTAHAVMSLNAQDNLSRRFIMVQIPENLTDKSETGKRALHFCEQESMTPNLCSIGKERIRRAGKKIKEDAGLTAADLDIGFRVLKLDSSNMEDVYYAPDKTSQDDLLSLISNIKHDRTPEDLLFQVMLGFGITLDSKIEETVISGKKVFKVAGNFLIACFDDNVTDDVVKAIATEQPTYAVLRDSSFANDSVAANFEQIFATYSPDTVRRVL